ncbi:MAG TPA: hypothetical protein VMY77_15480 [Chitinophagaceae bacterium]|nr:hypothetical protein [Chitinophagaceae bacterium]
MHSLITSYLLQSKECILPGIGILKIIHTPASTDTNDNRILPPFEGIIFKNEDHSGSPGLVKYIAGKKHIAISEAEVQLDNFCQEWTEKINAGEKLHFETVGSIQKNTDGVITFEKENSLNFFQPLPVENVYHKAGQPIPVVEEAVLPEPDIVTQDVVTQEVVVERSYWGFWALILLAIGFVLLFYHFKDHKMSGSNIGNQHKYRVESAGTMYQLSK